MDRRVRSSAFLVLLPLGLAAELAAAEITLAWDRNPESNIRCYRIYYGAVSRSKAAYSTMLEVGNVSEFTLRGLAPGPYFFAVTAVNLAGLESGYSNEVSTCDVNRDGLVDRLDLEILESVYRGTFACPSNCDVNLDGTVGEGDISALRTVLGVSAATPTPPSDTTPPVISNVAAHNITATSATITWTTNEPSDSLVRYGTTTSCGYTAGNGSMVLSHVQHLSGLSPDTLYHYRVESSDAAQNRAISAGFTFNTAPAEAQSMRLALRFPRSSPRPAAAPGSEFTGLAVAGLQNTAAYLAFTARDGSGRKVEAPELTNPAYRILTPRAQLAVLDSELFCSGSCDLSRVAYITAESTTDKLAAFYLFFDRELKVLDGADISPTTADRFILPEIAGQGFTRIDIINPNTEQAQVTVELRNAAGEFKSAALRFVGAGGALSLELSADLFHGTVPAPGDYMRVTADRGVLASEIFGVPTSYVNVLNAQPAGVEAAILYSPQYVAGAGYRTTLSVVNLDNIGDTVTFRLFSDDGQLLAVRELEIAPLGKLRVVEQDFFGSFAGGVQGYVEISARQARLTGSVVFGDSAGNQFSTALPLVRAPQTSMLFSHVASGSLWFMGIAIVNPGQAAATVTIDLYRKDGTYAGTKSVELPPRGRQSKLLTDYFPQLLGSGQEGGYVRLVSNQGVAAFALFGTRDLSVLSSIPAQPVP